MRKTHSGVPEMKAPAERSGKGGQKKGYDNDTYHYKEDNAYGLTIDIIRKRGDRLRKLQKLEKSGEWGDRLKVLVEQLTVQSPDNGVLQ